jgi:hypothetical protein
MAALLARLLVIIAALDHAVRQAGYTAEKHWASEASGRRFHHRLRDPHETKRVVEAICACLEAGGSYRQSAS